MIPRLTAVSAAEPESGKRPLKLLFDTDIGGGTGVPMREAPDGRTDGRTDAVKFIVRSSLEADGLRHMLAVGAQTNVALALREEPALADKLEGITLMGYEFDTLTAPFNVNNDLDAAQVLLTSGIPLRVLPVEIGVACQMQEGPVRCGRESTTISWQANAHR